MSGQRWLVVASVLSASMLTGNCTTKFRGASPGRDAKATPIPSPPPTPPPPIIPPPTPQPPLKEVKLKVVQRNSESWWKNCLEISVVETGDTQPIGCNKDTEATEVVLQVLEQGCNTIRVRARTYKNQGSTCASNPGEICNGPYATDDAFDWERGTDNPEGRQSFIAIQADQTLTALESEGLGRLIHLEPSLANQSTQQQASGVEESRVRVFFEDQNENRTLYLQQQAWPQWKEFGIDYNDFIFDIIGENVQIRFDGENPYAGTRPDDELMTFSNCQP